MLNNLNLGQDCEINIDDCLPNPCENNGTCIDLIDSFKCNCTEGFKGDTCSDLFDPCDQDPCLNDGSCSSLNGIVECNCKEGKCFQACLSIHFVSRFRLFTLGFSGQFCEKISCNPALCNGVCLENVCYCKVGFNGKW